MKFEDFLSARKYAHEQKKKAEETAPEEVPEQKDAVADAATTDYLIGLQTQSWEKEGVQDYRKYAELVWQEVIGEDTSIHAQQFKRFEGDMIKRLHELETQQFVFPDVRDALRDLIEAYGKTVEGVVLWSTGDISATGYQIAKIDRSRIILDFYKELQNALPKQKAKEFMREKTAYLVDDDKFERLREYAEKLLAERKPKTAEKIKIVIIEDMQTNFIKAREKLESALGHEAMDKLSIIPIWALYSRQARIKRKRAESEGRQEEFAETEKRLNGIRSFKDLLTSEQFREKLEGAHVLVDFDGVILDDDQRQVSQASAVLNPLRSAIAELGLDERKIRSRIEGK